MYRNLIEPKAATMIFLVINQMNTLFSYQAHKHDSKFCYICIAHPKRYIEEECKETSYYCPGCKVVIAPEVVT